MLEVRGLSLEVPIRRGWHRVLDGVSFEVGSGEVLGIAGLLGSGRTEILETLFGASAGRRSGAVRIEGVPVEVRSPRDARRLGIALVTEDRKAKGLHLDASIRDNVTLPSLARLARLGIRSARGEAAMAGEAVRRLGVRCTGIEQVAATLSGGNQQKVVIGKWLATRPRVLLLDEPTRGIDVGAKQEIYDLVRTLAGEGLAIVMVSSELPELLLLADRIMVVSEGRRTGMLSRAEASEEAVMHLAAPRGTMAHGIVTLLRLLSRTKLYWGLAAIFLIGVLTSPVSSKGNNIFLSYGNLLDVLRQVSITGLIATGMTAVIITAGIDLSVGSIMALCSVVCAMLLTVEGWTPAAAMGLPARGDHGLRRADGGDPVRAPPAPAGGVARPSRVRAPVRGLRRCRPWSGSPAPALALAVAAAPGRHQVRRARRPAGDALRRADGRRDQRHRHRRRAPAAVHRHARHDGDRARRGAADGRAEQRRAAGLHRLERGRRVRRAAQPRLRRRSRCRACSSSPPC